MESSPGDGPSLALLRRIETFKTEPPSRDWDGAWRIEK
jgi:adenylate cyclase